MLDEVPGGLIRVEAEVPGHVVVVDRMQCTAKLCVFVSGGPGSDEVGNIYADTGVGE